ncbi:MAG: putative zinc-binding metallopeptidase [Candidatus Omnitrophica bacterium]|nr:putative zinc-binding metallopeptidase [Candidatus Omnitrophota bacterium]
MIKKTIDLDKLSIDELLGLRISDLPLSIKGTWLEECVGELYRELDVKGIGFKPICYLADEWLAPDKEPVIGVPFFLAHPALLKLERKMMFEAEGGTKEQCARLLRHEAGHAVNYAYRLYRKNKWRELFGPFSSEYEDTYRFRPYSKSFVRHLEKHYAQCHPDEDFAETFAVWLTPGGAWRAEYTSGKAKEKLLYVDALMKKIGSRSASVKKGKKHWRLSSLRITLKNYYKKKQDQWAEEFPDFHDAYLKRIFSESSPETEKITKASNFIKSFRKVILNNAAVCTGERKFLINDLLKVLVNRCRELKLYLRNDEAVVLVQISTYVTALVMNYAYTGRFKG